LRWSSQSALSCRLFLDPRSLSRRTRGVSAVAAAFVVLGPTATSRVETIGLHRNAIAAIVVFITSSIFSESIIGDGTGLACPSV
jgi:hypothetical protein